MTLKGNSFPRVLLVEDNDMDAALISRVLSGAYSVSRASTLHQARTIVHDAAMDIALVDYKLPDGDGLELLDELRKNDPDIPVVFVTAANDARTGIAALRGGAEDFIVKDENYLEGLPVIVDKTIRVARERARTEVLSSELKRHKRELELLRRQVERGSVPTLIGDSDAMRELRRHIELAGRTDETVIVTGDTGVGKELVARSIHLCSTRAGSPFLAVNCATLPESIVESELFGHKRGAFTGADRDKLGYFQATAAGTLFLDEIAELPLTVQAKLLRVLQENSFTPIGSVRPERFGGRVIAATNTDLSAAIRDGRLRKDLYYRLRVIPVHVPALGDRREDIPHLAQHFLDRYNARNGTDFARFTEPTLVLLTKASWPGNVRELENFIYRLLAMTEVTGDEVAMPDIIRDELVRHNNEESAAILTALERNCWNRQKAAEELGVSRTTLWRRMQYHGIASR